MKVTLKIKIFMWFLYRSVLSTKDNLAKMYWQRSKTCCFYEKDESIQHLFFNCMLAKIIWHIMHMSLACHHPLMFQIYSGIV
jgi:hypothetical protein